MVTILISATFRRETLIIREALIRSRRLRHGRRSKWQRLLEGDGSSVKLSNSGHFLKSQGKIFVISMYPFLHISDT